MAFNHPPPLLQIDNATVVKTNQRVLDSINLSIAEGEHTAILGPNGAGKSSLIKLITHQDYALAHADGSPSITLFGRYPWNIFELRAMLGIVSADLHHIFTGPLAAGHVSGLDAVISGFHASYGLFQHMDVTEAQRRQAERELEIVGASHLAGKRLEQMSTGETRRILIARALVTQPRALLLDEPTTGLDLVTRQRFLLTLQHIARQGKTIILVTHHVEEIIPEIGRVILLSGGRIVADGPKQAMLSDQSLSTVFGAPVRVSESGGFYSATSTAEADLLG